MPRRHIKKMRGFYVSFQELSFFQNLTEKEKRLSWEAITKAADAFDGTEAETIGPVSYTHLDVYKRQDVSEEKYYKPFIDLYMESLKRLRIQSLEEEGGKCG